MTYKWIKFSPILLLSLTIAIAPSSPALTETMSELKTNDLPTVSTTSDLEKANGRSVKLVGTYVGSASILSWRESSSGKTFIVLEAKLVTKDNTQVPIYADAPMLGKYMRSENEVKRYHDREVVVTGKITKEKDRFSIISEKIDLR